MNFETTERLWNAILIGLDVIEYAAIVLPVAGLLMTIVLTISPRLANRRLVLPTWPRRVPRPTPTAMDSATPAAPGTWLRAA